MYIFMYTHMYIYMHMYMHVMHMNMFTSQWKTKKQHRRNTKNVGKHKAKQRNGHLD